MYEDNDQFNLEEENYRLCELEGGVTGEVEEMEEDESKDEEAEKEMKNLADIIQVRRRQPKEFDKQIRKRIAVGI